MGETAKIMAQVGDHHLRQLIARIEKLEEEKRTIAEDIKEVYAEAKALGYDTKAMRAVIRIRRMDREERDERAAIVALYMRAVGMTPIESLAAGEPVPDDEA